MDFVTALELGVEAGQDAEHLVRALQDRRVILTHDASTFTDAANQRLKNGEEMFGLIVVPQTMPIGQAIDELEIIVLCSKENEYENRPPEHLPLGLA